MVCSVIELAKNHLMFNYRHKGKLTNPTTYSTNWNFSVGLTYYFDRNMF